VGPTKTYGLTSPTQRGDGVADLQRALVTNPFAVFYVGEVDGEFGPLTAQACARAKWLLGYPQAEVKQTGGKTLYAYLREAQPLPATYAAKRRYRLWKERNRGAIRQRALEEARRHVGVKESPPGSNDVYFSRWYDLLGPWCAMFVTYCYVTAGSKGFKRGAYWAYCPYLLAAARAGENGASITRDPQPGDIVLYLDSTGLAFHVGIFERWLDKASGRFQSIEGNTSSSSDSDGGAVEVRDRSTGSMRCVFVSMAL
jgi:hypothetical protein